MSNLYPITQTINGNERAFALYEINEQSPGSRGIRRYQVILVNRDGRLAEFRKDMGSSKQFKGVNQINIPALWEHTCDELIALANELREGVVIDLDELLQMDKDNFKLA